MTNRAVICLIINRKDASECYDASSKLYNHPLDDMHCQWSTIYIMVSCEEHNGTRIKKLNNRASFHMLANLQGKVVG